MNKCAVLNFFHFIEQLSSKNVGADKHLLPAFKRATQMTSLLSSDFIKSGLSSQVIVKLLTV